MERFKYWGLEPTTNWLKSLWSTKHHFSFLTVHYLWIIFLSLLGSIILWGAGRGRNGQMDYIDALFFTAGASTQAGLNTIDLNQLNTFQQVVLYLWPMMTNPITMSASVVFLRLYWFEEKLEHLNDLKKKWGTISRSRAKAKSDDDDDVERGVNGRKITVMLNGARSRIGNDGTLLQGNTPNPNNEQNRLGISHAPAKPSGSHNPPAPPELRKPEIKFAPKVIKSDGLGEDALKLPAWTDEEHIAIVERQKKDDDEVLRIPNPREAELGIVPKRVQAGDIDESDPISPRAEAFDFHFDEDDRPRSPAHGARPQAITIEEPDRTKLQETESDDFSDNARAAGHTLSVFKPRLPRSWAKSHRKNDGAGPSDTGTSRTTKRRQSLQALRTAFSQDKANGTPYLSWEPTIGRNSAFPDLTEEQREELGGIEYRSLKTLAVILTVYFWGFSILGVIGCVPWILNVDFYGKIVDQAAQSRAWWGIFTPQSAFMDQGFTLTPDSMNSFNRATWPLLLMSFLIIVGNTGFPIMLRFMIWICSLVVPAGTGLYEELRFLLDHPRRCFTLLFPSSATWWLLLLLVILNGVDVMFFTVLDLGTGPVADLPAGIKVLNGFFEAASTRTAGFSCVSLADLHPAVQVSYMIMMYISVFPIAISVRRTNVYEEKSLGIYSNPDEMEEHSNKKTDWAYVGSHARRQLSFDLPYIACGIFILAISEGSKLMDPEAQKNGFTMFAILFETVSAYGTVGMSLGYKTVNASLCSQFSVVGKLVLVAMMVRGRHRGLPYALDRAILLPGESLNAKDEAAAACAGARMTRQDSRASVITGGGQGPSAASLRRQRSQSGVFTSLFHPGPSAPVIDLSRTLPRRSTETARHDDETHATRVTSRRTEPGTSRRLNNFSFTSPRPQTAGGHDNHDD
ncbi:Low-affinity potassium transport protein [Cladorrhinum samala]|uniref:Potassium transport protein n=1 Tax=Cladorrhinum samala TaxID=585594 RepID=A0AAV9HI79_9PEZI|nr:Low-affinity potassium transport protein [Cladorrhinum samala]